MFEALRRKSHFDTEAAMRSAADSLAHAGRAPVMLGSLVAMAIVGMVTRAGVNRMLRDSKPKVITARRARATVKAVKNEMSAAPRNGRGKKRKTKAAAQAH